MSSGNWIYVELPEDLVMELWALRRVSELVRGWFPSSALTGPPGIAEKLLPSPTREQWLELVRALGVVQRADLERKDPAAST